RETAQSGLHTLPAGAITTPVTLGGAKMQAVLAQLRQHFEYVLLDAPRWDAEGVAASLGQLCDALYLVVHEAEAETAETRTLLDAIPKLACPLRGCVLTQR